MPKAPSSRKVAREDRDASSRKVRRSTKEKSMGKDARDGEGPVGKDAEAKKQKKRRKAEEPAAKAEPASDDARASCGSDVELPSPGAADQFRDGAGGISEEQSKEEDLAAAAAAEPELDPRLVRQISALANKISESNLEAMIGEVETMYLNFPRAAVTTALTRQILESVADKVHLLDSFVMVYAALLNCVAAVVGGDVPAQFVHACVTRWLAARRVPARAREACNLLVLVGFLYNFQLVACPLIYDLVRAMAQDMSEQQVEMLVKIAKLCGVQLRQDDPQALRDMVDLIQEQAHALAAQRTAAGNGADGDALGFRFRFMLETLDDLRSNKAAQRKHLFFAFADAPLAKFCAGFARKRGAARPEPMRPSLDDIVNWRARGMWWRVGSAWAGHDSKRIKSDAERAKAKESALLRLARKHRMNTDVRRSIFVVMMSSEDFMDAFERLTKLGLKEVQEREIVRVIVHCAGQESAYNPFYAVLAQKFCMTRHAFKITFQFVLWDFLKQDVEAGSVASDKKLARRVAHTARLYAHLVAARALPMAVLRVLEMARLAPVQVAFLRAFLSALRAACADSKIAGSAAHVPSAGRLAPGVELGIHGAGGHSASGGVAWGKVAAATSCKDILRVADEIEKTLRVYG